MDSNRTNRLRTGVLCVWWGLSFCWVILSTPLSPRADDQTAIERTSGESFHPRSLEEIKKSGYLNILTRNNATSFFIHKGHRMGFDYELGKALATSIGVRARFIVPKNWNDLIPALKRGEGDVIAGEMTVTPARALEVQFAEPYLTTRELIIYKKGSSAPQTADDLSGQPVRVRTGSSYFVNLTILNARLSAQGRAPAQIQTAPETEETEDIIAKVHRGEVPFTIADELIARPTVAFLKDLVLGPPLSEKSDLAWAVRKDEPALLKAVNDFFKKSKRSAFFNVLKKRYFERMVEFRAYARDTIGQNQHRSISPFDRWIFEAASKQGTDWRLLAAQIYQESQFEPHRKSWCGAQGLLQIMPSTARELGVKNPYDPREGITAGARYMGKLMNRFSDVMDPNERYKFALASYNCGAGHVEDARHLAKRKGWDDRVWSNVQKTMLLLSHEEYHGQTRFGYCRCGEPVGYVQEILERYDAYRQIVADSPPPPNEPVRKLASQGAKKTKGSRAPASLSTQDSKSK